MQHHHDGECLAVGALHHDGPPQRSGAGERPLHGVGGDRQQCRLVALMTRGALDVAGGVERRVVFQQRPPQASRHEALSQQVHLRRANGQFVRQSLSRSARLEHQEQAQMARRCRLDVRDPLQDVPRPIGSPVMSSSILPRAIAAPFRRSAAPSQVPTRQRRRHTVPTVLSLVHTEPMRLHRGLDRDKDGIACERA